jgi:dipeptidyl aminopeptidase/acylaminoacyl peptidase
MKKTRLVSHALAVVLVAYSVFASAQDRMAASLDAALQSLFAVRHFEQVAIAPDGAHVAYVERAHGGNSVFVASMNASSTTAQRISAASDNATHDENDGAWSPDGKKLAFLSDAERAGQLQLYVSNLDGRPPQKLTTLTGFLADPAWSPDGRTIALLFTENAPRAAGPLMPMTPETGVIESKVYEQRLTTVDTESGQVRQISPADMYVYEYNWSPDSKSFALTAAHGAGDSNWYVAQLYALSAESADMKSIYKPPLQIAVPRWSTDGKNIAFISGIMSDEGSTGGDIFVVSPGGGSPRNVTPQIKASATGLRWQSADNILFSEILDGETGLATLDVNSGKVSQIWSGPESVSLGGWGQFGASVAADGKTSAVVRQSFTHAPEVWAGPLGSWNQITHVNEGVKPSWGDPKSFHWTSDGQRVQGWLLYPVSYDPKQRYPMVVVVHGGPAAAEIPSYPGPFYNTSLLSTRGYFVFYPNPRGSFGQGESFTRGNVKDFGYGDFRDILSGVEKIVKELPVDNNRVGITGWSYGGFMTMWAVTQTSRFRAAVSGAGLANWQSYYGQNDIDEWMIPYFGASVYQDPAVYAKSAPINFITKAKTPTLVLVGERDGECPAPQSREFWHGLKAMGVKTQLVIYANEGHYIAQPEHERDIVHRMVNWFDEHMKAQ